MIFGGAGGLLSLITPILAKPLILLCYPFLAYFTKVVELFAKINLQIGIETIPVTVIIGYYLMLIVLVIKLNKYKIVKK